MYLFVMTDFLIVCLPLAAGEGQFGRVFKAIAEGICPQDNNRNIVAVKTLKGKAIGRSPHHLCLPFSLCPCSGPVVPLGFGLFSCHYKPHLL